MKVINTKKGQSILVDDDDFEMLNTACWCINSVGYALRSIGKRQILMHRVIMNVADGLYVDHINHNTVDNRKENLRICTQSQNMRNSKVASNNRSGVKGVYFHNVRKKWMARINVNRKNIYLGFFDNKQDAINARYKAEDKYFGEFKYSGDLISQGKVIVTE